MQIINFTVVNQSVGYNVIIGIPVMKEMRMMLSIYHLTVKFSTPHGTGRINQCQYDYHDCYNRALKFDEKKSQQSPGHDTEILTIEERMGSRKNDALNQLGGSMCNLISIEELPEGYFEEKGIQLLTSYVQVIMKRLQNEGCPCS